MGQTLRTKTTTFVTIYKKTQVLPHWTEQKNKEWKDLVGKSFTPPDEIHAKYYPNRGLYNSNDEKILKEQFKEMRRAGICGVVVSWWGRPDEEGTHDTQGVNTDEIVETVVRAAMEVEGIFIGFHLEPYVGRSASKVFLDVQYLNLRFQDFSSTLLKDDRGRIVYYIYDSYHISSSDWKQELKELRDESFFVGLVLDRNGVQHVVDSDFDGGYTYFASDGFSFGSTTSNWNSISNQLHDHDVAFIPSVGPGYDDSSIRPWNVRFFSLHTHLFEQAHNTKARENGAYYERMFKAAIESNPDAVSITSFNEWGEGTQIESASKRRVLLSDHVKLKNPHLLNEAGDRVYASYKDDDPYFYIDITQRFVRRWEKQGRHRSHHEGASL